MQYLGLVTFISDQRKKNRYVTIPVKVATGWLSIWLNPYSFASLPFDKFAEFY
jgi:hypothetical protein